MGIYTPKISPSKLLWGKNDVRTATEQFYTRQKLLYPHKQISGYAPGIFTSPMFWLVTETIQFRTTKSTVVPFKYGAEKYRHFRNDSLSISGASSARCTLAQL